MKRYRRVVAKARTLAIRFGVEGRGSSAPPDIVYTYGEGCDRSDIRMLHWRLTERHRVHGVKDAYENSFFQELEARGYDLSTLRFSIQLKDKAP